MVSGILTWLLSADTSAFHDGKRIRHPLQSPPPDIRVSIIGSKLARRIPYILMMRDIKFGNGTDSVGWGGRRVSFVESSLIETSITVPAVNAAFYACARGTTVSRCHRPLFFWRQGIHFNYELGRPLLVSTDLISTRISAVRNLRHVPFTLRAISFHYFCLLEYGCSKWKKLEFAFSYIIFYESKI